MNPELKIVDILEENPKLKLLLTMKKLLPILLLFTTIQLSAQYDSIFAGGDFRTYLLHLPPQYDGTAELPLVIAMHGGFGSGPQLGNQSKLSEKADEAGFVVVYPEGVAGPLNIRTWNAGGCCGYAMNNNIDDVGFISALIDTLLTDLAIDSSRVYATGMSNGAFMSYRLACEIPEKIAAIAPVAGTMNVDFCEPSRAVPVIQFHSFEDSNVPYLGGVGDGVSNHYNPPIDSVQNAWAAMNHCAILNDTLHDGADYTHIRWSDCDCMYEQQFYITTDGGHSWPGGMQTIIGDPPSEVINANDLMWDFFQLYSLECETSATKILSEIGSEIFIFPNPATEYINVRLGQGNPQEGILQLFGTNGRMLFHKKTGDHFNQIDLRGLAPGLYFIRFQNGRVTVSEKFVKLSR